MKNVKNHSSCSRLRRKETGAMLRGFSLLEVLLATFIFSIVMVSVTVYFAGIARANQNSKRLQQNLEDVRFAMNRIAKVLRTSVVISPKETAGTSVSTVRVFDYSQSKCFQYEFVSSGMMEYEANPPSGTTDEKAWCETAALSSVPLVSVSSGASLQGTFFVSTSEDTASNERAGRIMMNAKITRASNSSTIQTTVSLRNFEEVFH